MQQHSGQHVLSAAFDRLFARPNRQLSPRHLRLHDRSRPRVVPRRDRRRRSRGQPRRLGKPSGRDSLRQRRRGGCVAASEGNGPRRHAAADRHRRLRSVGVRRHARRAHRIDRRDRDRRGRAVQGRTARGVRVRRPGARTGSGRCATRSAAAVRLLSVLPHELPDAIERLQAETRERQRSLTALEQELARYRAADLAATAEATATGKAGARRVDADANGLKVPRLRDCLASGIRRRAGVHVASGRRRRRAIAGRVGRGQPGDCRADRELWRTRRRKAGSGAGRRPRRPGRGDSRERSSAYRPEYVSARMLPGLASVCVTTPAAFRLGPETSVARYKVRPSGLSAMSR